MLAASGSGEAQPFQWLIDTDRVRASRCLHCSECFTCRPVSTHAYILHAFLYLFLSVLLSFFLAFFLSFFLAFSLSLCLFFLILICYFCFDFLFYLCLFPFLFFFFFFVLRNGASGPVAYNKNKNKKEKVCPL